MRYTTLLRRRCGRFASRLPAWSLPTAIGLAWLTQGSVYAQSAPAVAPSTHPATPAPAATSERTLALLDALKKFAVKNFSDAQIERDLDDLFDLNALTEAPISPHKKAFTAAQWETFHRLFYALVRHRAWHAGAALREGNVHVGAPQIRGRRTWVDVHIEDAQKDLDSHVAFIWQGVGPAARVVDVAFDGASVVADYRNQFGRILKKDGAQVLIDRVGARLHENDPTP